MASDAEIIEALLRRGWTPPLESARKDDVTEAIGRLFQPEFCGITQQLSTEEIGQRFCPWPEPVISWSILEAIPALGFEKMKLACEAALADIASHFELEFPYEENDSKANIVIEVHNLGAPMGVLADCQLVPCGPLKNAGLTLLMRVDVNEQWVVANTPAGLAIDWQRVFAHEWCHGLGLPHITAKNSLMLPTYSQSIRGLQAGDIEALELLGYKRRTKPKPVEPPVIDVQLSKSVGYRYLPPGRAFTPAKRAWVLEEL